MIFRRFNLLIILRVLALVTTIGIFMWIFGDGRLFFNQLIIACVIIFQVIELIHFLNQTNRELTRFFLAIKHSDFSISYKENKLGKSFNELHGSLAAIIDAYKQVKIEKEIQYQFLQKLVTQINIGIISLEGDRIGLINPTAENLLNISGVKNWNLVRQINPSTSREIDSMLHQGRKLIEINSGDHTRLIAAEVSSMTILEKEHRLITMQDINSEIEQKEIEAWHKLIRILTHEIMNSVTPITSLSETMQSLLLSRDGEQKRKENISDDTIGDILFSFCTIHKRGEGLLHFVENYRTMSRVPKPSMEEINVESFLRHVKDLLSADLSKDSIDMTIESSPRDLNFKGDPKLLEQVLINLATNAIHAVVGKKEKQILMRGYNDDRNVILEVTDNGVGIPDKEIKEIFVPFFSTKQGGSGIGLSLSKQIMALHGGSIKVTSRPGQGTSFFLNFKKESLR